MRHTTWFWKLAVEQPQGAQAPEREETKIGTQLTLHGWIILNHPLKSRISRFCRPYSKFLVLAIIAPYMKKPTVILS